MNGLQDFLGGDQSYYSFLFLGVTPGQSFVNTISTRVNAGQLSFGGISAGLAVQGSRVFRRPTVDETLTDVILSPRQVYSPSKFGYYSQTVDKLFDFNILQGVLTDTH